MYERDACVRGTNGCVSGWVRCVGEGVYQRVHSRPVNL